MEQVAKMAQLPKSRYGLLYQTPEGVFALSDEDGVTGSVANRYVISTNQLCELMRERGITADQVRRDEKALARLAAAVAEFRPTKAAQS